MKRENKNEEVKGIRIRRKEGKQGRKRKKK